MVSTAAKPFNPHGPRYEAMGRAVTVPVAEWIGDRLQTTTDKEQ